MLYIYDNHVDECGVTSLSLFIVCYHISCLTYPFLEFKSYLIFKTLYYLIIIRTYFKIKP